jgi:hypothetical protein
MEVQKTSYSKRSKARTMLDLADLEQLRMRWERLGYGELTLKFRPYVGFERDCHKQQTTRKSVGPAGRPVDCLGLTKRWSL